jgi:hypothetical protein
MAGSVVVGRKDLPVSKKAIGRVDYAAGAPVGYACSKCTVAGLKLWREYQPYAGYDHIDLFCASCACANQKIADDVDADGKVSSPLSDHTDRTDQIGGLIPAVPTEDGFWPYTLVPDVAVAWWKRLPTRRIDVDVPLTINWNWKASGLNSTDILQSKPIPKPGPKADGFAPWIADKLSRLVVASDGKGNGAAIFAVGAVVLEIDEIVSPQLMDLGLDDAPAGITIWEGRVAYWESGNPLDGTEYNSELKGTFRRLTVEELTAVAEGKAPWNKNEWLLDTVLE